MHHTPATRIVWPHAPLSIPPSLSSHPPNHPLSYLSLTHSLLCPARTMRSTPPLNGRHFRSTKENIPSSRPRLHLLLQEHTKSRGARREAMVHPVAEADERSPFGRLTTEAYCARHGVTHSSSTLVNPRGLRIFTQRWAPPSSAPSPSSTASPASPAGWSCSPPSTSPSRASPSPPSTTRGTASPRASRPTSRTSAPCSTTARPASPPSALTTLPRCSASSTGSPSAAPSRCCCTSPNQTQVSRAREHRTAQGPQPAGTEARCGRPHRSAAAAVAGSRAAPPPCRPSNHRPGPGATRNSPTPCCRARTRRGGLHSPKRARLPSYRLPPRRLAPSEKASRRDASPPS